MKTASAAKIAAQFDDYLDASLDQPVLITRNGKAVAVMVPVPEADSEPPLTMIFVPEALNAPPPWL